MKERYSWKRGSAKYTYLLRRINYSQPPTSMTEKKNVFVIIGSASNHSANEKLVCNFARLTNKVFNLTVFTVLETLPHFDPNDR